MTHAIYYGRNTLHYETIGKSLSGTLSYRQEITITGIGNGHNTR